MPPFEVIITHLELDPGDFKPKRSGRTDVAFSHVDPPIPELNRFFYLAVGGRWFWLDRRLWTLAQWTERVANKDRIETWILSVGGVPAGYVELQRLSPDIVEIDYLGLLDSFIGGGLGAHLLTSAVERAVAMGAAKVLLNTCNLDHPKARANYEARGFRAVRTELKMREIPSTPVSTAREALRYAVAVVAYRGGKATRNAPPGFGEFRVGEASRTPVQVLAHINDLYDWAYWMAKGKWVWANSVPSSWDAEVVRFHTGLTAFDGCLESPEPLGQPIEKFIAGPIADSLTHIGQINMLRRMAGSPVKGESYARAEIVAGRVGAEQAAPRVEFD